MSIATIVLLVGVTVAVAAIALYLISIVMILKKVNFTLGTITAGLGAIEMATAPIKMVTGDINTNLEKIASAVRDRITARLAAERGPDASTAQARIEQLLSPALGGPEK